MSNDMQVVTGGSIVNGQADDVVRAKITAALEATCQLVQGQVTERCKSIIGQTGEYQKSWVGQLLDPVTARVASLSPYATYLETGTRPHFLKTSVIYSNIVPWTTRVLGLSGKDAVSAAFAVARNIGKRGTSQHARDIGMGHAGPTGGYGYYPLETVLKAALPRIQKQIFEPLGVTLTQELSK